MKSLCRNSYLRHEDQARVEDSLLEEGGRGEEAGEQVDAAHHLNGGHLVRVEQLVLPVGGERVAGHVAEEKEHA